MFEAYKGDSQLGTQQISHIAHMDIDEIQSDGTKIDKKKNLTKIGAIFCSKKKLKNRLPRVKVYDK